MAICPTTNEIWIFETGGNADISKWTKVSVLKEHFNVISALDWHPQTNLLLSASTDRAVIIWDQIDGGTPRPQMGVLNEKKANLDASWSTKGDKFCVGSSSGIVYVGTYSSQANFWVAHGTKKEKPIHKASVICTRFDPLSGRAVASCSLDGTIQITSCYKEEVDGSNNAGPFGGVTSYGEQLFSMSCNGWVNGLAFAPNSALVSYVT